MPSSFSDVLLVGGVPNQWIKLVSNGIAQASGTAYVSDAVTTFPSSTQGGGVFSFATGPPADIYTVWTLSGSLSATQPASGDTRWVATGNTSYVVAYTAGDSASLKAATIKSSSPNNPSPLALPGGQVWGTKYVMAPPPTGVGATDFANLTALVAGGNVIVQLQPGNYVLNAQLILTSNTWLRGAGRGVTLITRSDAADTAIVGTTKNGTTQTIYTNIAISDLTLKSGFSHLCIIYNTDGVNVSNVEGLFTVTVPVREAIMITHCQHVTVGLCYVHAYTGDGITLQHCRYFTVVGNLVDGGSTADDGIDIDSDFLDTQSLQSMFGTVTGNVVLNHTAGCGIRIEDSQYVSVTGNQIDTVTTPTGDVSGILVNSGFAAAGTTQHIVVADNVVSNCVTWGIGVSPDGGAGTCKHVSIIGNNLDNCGQVGGSNIRGGIVVAGTDVDVADNYLTSCGGNDANGGALMVYKGDRVRLTDNVISTATFGVRCWNGDTLQVYTDVLVDNNRMVGVTTQYVDATIGIGAGGKGIQLLTTQAGKPQVVAFNASLSVDASLGEYILPITLTAAITAVNAPTNAVKGMKLTFTFVQDGTGARAVGGWNAIFKQSWSDTGNTLGKRSSISFVFDSVNWNQVGAQTPYV